jgi:hypothetical protein
MMTRKTIAAASLLLFSFPARADTAGPTASHPSGSTSSTTSQTSAAVVSDEPAAVADSATPHQHAGIFLRAYLGAGYRSMSATDTSMKISGGGGSFGLAIGGTVAENLILLGELMVEVAQNPTIEMGAQSTDTTDASLAFLGLGPGVAYYIMPANVHLGASLLLTEATLTYKGTKIAETDWGFGGVVRVGKDFWIGKNFGLGALGQFSLASMNDKANDAGPTPTWTATAASLALEATFN